MTFAPATPHDPIAEIGEDVFMARGSLRMGPILRISRNMAIVRRGGELTLVNPIRLNDAELERLDGLGTVRHLVRLGAHHGLDDPFYMDRYTPAFWCQEGGTEYSSPAIDHVLTEGGMLPFDGARLFCFNSIRQPESALLVETGKGLLLTCDALQHYGDYSNNNLPARLMMPFIGFPKGTLIGPFWLKMMTPEGGSLRPEFERLLMLDFDALLAAHGTLLPSGAHQAVRRTVDKTFGGAAG